MQLQLNLEAIYQGSLCKLSASAADTFALGLDARVISSTKGVPVQEKIASVEDKGRHQIELDLLGCIKERATDYPPSDPQAPGSACRYGMSYFPFVSSHFALQIDGGAGLAALVIEIPAGFRMIWKSIKVLSPSGKLATVHTSMGEKSCKYVLSWEGEQEPGIYQINFDVRTGGPGLLRAAYFPLYYYLIALLAVAAAAHAERTNILLGVIGASWVFFLRHVNACEIPRRSVLLLYATIVLALFLLVWGISWRLQLVYHNEWLLAIETLLAALIFGFGIYAVQGFEADGVLPRVIVRLWGRLVSRMENSLPQ